MAIIKCKMCGGDLILTQGQSVAECEYCGSRQTVPAADNEKKLTLFARANRLRATCEFDKSAGIYESIVADFPEEAEAYWGLVLCKYGIEYVDDPGTGKKIPTCHRSSFDSVMDDGNFEQAMENADGAARRVYREEAKQVEEIRKGIIAVSANEEPYDIFICYKETDERGERTLDSVLAQDVYDALTDKGYRVFFSRITLEDKLGVEFEPYIFAALNSAKIMLAFGTDYEYFNAVWVKNEWSRFLKLMVNDKSKHLIPCFKGIDAYDMPKEFARLQAQDLGKVGAMQDLLRGIEKLLPKQKNTTVIQERVVVGGSGNNKIASLLDRGNMALEDGDWAKADSFFEDVLNNDSKNAQAYLGKTLAQERCRTIDAFARKRKKETQYAQPQKLRLEPNEAHVDEMVGRYAIPGYVQQNEIRKLYQFDLSYTSEVAERMRQHRDEVNFWANHKLLSRAEKFAAGAVAENFQREKKALFAALADRVKQAENAEAAAKTDVQERYEAHLKQADQQAEALYNAGLARREAYYQELLGTAKQSSDIAELTNTAKKFDQLGDYQDSRNLAEHCRKRVTEEQEKINAERERQRRILEQQQMAKKAADKRNAIISAVVAVLVIAVVVVITTVVIPADNYRKAEALLVAGDYEGAINAFTEMDGYKDSEEYVRKAQYLRGIQLTEAGEYEAAYEYWIILGDYEDVQVRLQDYILCPVRVKTEYGTIYYAYDEGGKLIEEKNVDDTGECVYSYEYDEQGRCTKRVSREENYNSGLIFRKTITYTYDSEGRLISARTTTSYGYSTTTEYFYDDNDNCIKQVEISDDQETQTTIYTFDAAGYCIKKVYKYAGGGVRFTNTTEYTYDDMGRCIKEAFDSGRTIEYVYDSSGKLEKEITTTEEGSKVTAEYLEYCAMYKPDSAD